MYLGSDGTLSESPGSSWKIGDDGYVEIPAIGNGTYTLIESVAPEGLSCLEPLKITIRGTVNETGSVVLGASVKSGVGRVLAASADSGVISVAAGRMSSPGTGDNTNLIVYVVTIIASLACLVLIGACALARRSGRLKASRAEAKNNLWRM